MRLCLKLLFVFLINISTAHSQDLIENYILEWRQFYPSKAVQSGLHSYSYHYENHSKEMILQWLAYNQKVLTELDRDQKSIDPIDRRLLRVQVQSEVDKWQKLATQTSSLKHYSQLISRAIPSILSSKYLLAPEKSTLICSRLKALNKLSLAALSNLKTVPKKDLELGIAQLKNSLSYLESGLPQDLLRNELNNSCPELSSYLQVALQNLNDLIKYAESSLWKIASESKSTLGRVEYNRRLKLYTDSDLTSTSLAEMALEEISVTKKVMAEVSRKYLLKTYPNITLPSNNVEIITRALTDMEKDAPINAEDYLQFWQQLAGDAMNFIRENDIATLPEHNTLRIQTAPESAGPAARIGWVAAAPPFDPNPVTTLYLPSIPDTLPEQEQIDFWSSFNRPFNRMIVIHELLPGHYMQLKISRETAHPIRLMFPYGPYVEGWATFTEMVLLDEGWESDDPLTYLAHLRKRLENANRAYTSVQVHCNGWDQEQVMNFSTQTSLLAPQFAKSLWGRIARSPMQLTSYFYGGAQFKELFKKEKERLGDQFNLKLFMDTIMKAGSIPVDEFYAIFKLIQPN